jgi:hypothetical protein
MTHFEFYETKGQREKTHFEFYETKGKFLQREKNTRASGALRKSFIYKTRVTARAPRPTAAKAENDMEGAAPEAVFCMGEAVEYSDDVSPEAAEATGVGVATIYPAGVEVDSAADPETAP